ncbi:hypothetical protein HDU93_004518 [Gonapodya sp. JEL0774]|nr:hypothetical protein HDU93_004518 [Gonapodya sp. JEL0774]
MKPSFPTLTFPNHYTIATGLYPAWHGIVANEFYDPQKKRTFSYRNVSDDREEMWWSAGEPIWITVEKSGLRSACIMWPGSEAPHGPLLPTYLVRFQPHMPVSTKVEYVLGLLALDPPDRPSLITMYVPEVDGMGHTVGPDDGRVSCGSVDRPLLASDSAGGVTLQLDATLGQVDGELGKLFDGIEKGGFGSMVDVIVVSDHGMAQMSPDRVIYLSDIVSLDPHWIVTLDPLLFLFPPDEQSGVLTLSLLHDI